MKLTVPLCLLAVGFTSARADINAVNLGLDYTLRGIAIQNNDTEASTQDNLNYYSHQARAYMTAWLSRDVEAGLRVQSINIWGLEGSAAAPATVYPFADGIPWIEQAFLRMPNLFNKHLELTIGRQALVIGDGMLVSDDDRGFNALRAKAHLPFQMDLDLFTAKIGEGLSEGGDSDLNGAVWGLQQGENRWELGWIQENSGALSDYRLASTTTWATDVSRTFYDLRLFGDLKDAYYQLEYVLQSGDAALGTGNSSLSGNAQRIELGAQSDTVRFGRFGVRAVYASGSGDDPNSVGEDEGFRAPFGARWDGLQRDGWGRHFGATVSDAYNPAAPFSPSGTGLPPGASGIKTLGVGIQTVQRVRWTGSLDYFMYDSRAKVNGQNALGAELDLGLDFRYSGAVTFNAAAAYFFPGDLYPESNRVSRYTAEAQFHF